MSTSSMKWCKKLHIAPGIDLWHFHFISIKWNGSYRFISSEMEMSTISSVHFNEILKGNCHRISCLAWVPSIINYIEIIRFHFKWNEMETLSISLVHFNEILKVNCHRPTSKSMNHLYQIFRKKPFYLFNKILSTGNFHWV